MKVKVLTRHQASKKEIENIILSIRTEKTR